MNSYCKLLVAVDRAHPTAGTETVEARLEDPVRTYTSKVWQKLAIIVSSWVLPEPLILADKEIKQVIPAEQGRIQL